MVDFVGDFGSKLTDGVAGQFSHMHDRFDSPQIGGVNLANVLRERHRYSACGPKERSFPVEPGVGACNLVTFTQKLGPEQRAKIPFTSRQKNSHKNELRLFERVSR